MGKTNGNRRKGLDAERHYASLFREMGYEKCLTSRYASRMHDSAGIDLVNLPFNVQVKAGRQSHLSMPNLLSEIKGRIREAFPEGSKERNQPLVVIHHRQGRRGKERTEFDSIVCMSFSDFLSLLPASREARNERKEEQSEEREHFVSRQ